MILVSVHLFGQQLTCSVRMICAKNYEAVSKFVTVMPRILWPLFFWTRCMYNNQFADVKFFGFTINCTTCN